MILPITALYAVLLAAIGLYLMSRAARIRGKTGISIFHDDDVELAQAVRRHGNFIENVPLVLILMVVVEVNGGNGILLHVTGTGLVLARIAHPIGLRHDRQNHPLRIVGTAATALTTLVLGGVALWQAVGAP